MDVRMPDGTTIVNVPPGTTKRELGARYRRLREPSLSVDRGRGRELDTKIRSGAAASQVAHIKAGLADEMPGKIRAYAADRFPHLPEPDRVKLYGVRDGEIYYRDPKTTRLYWETPPGAYQTVRRFVGEVTGSAPSMIGGGLGAMAGPGGAAFGAGAGELLRQKLGESLYGDPVSPLQVGVAAGVDALGAGLARKTVKLSRGYGKPQGRELFEAAPKDMGALDTAAEREMVATAKRRGIELTPVESTGSKRLADSLSLLGDLPRTADAVDTLRQSRTQQVDDAVRGFLDELSGLDSAYDVGQRTSAAARTAIEGIDTEATKAASPLYQQAFAEAGPVDTTRVAAHLDDALQRVPPTSSVGKALRRVRAMVVTDDAARQAPQPTAPRVRSEGPRTQPPLEPFPTRKQERKALRERYGQPGVRVDAKSGAVDSVQYTYDDRATLLGVVESGTLNDVDRRSVQKVLDRVPVTPWETVRIKELLEAGKEAATGPVPAPRAGARLTAQPPEAPVQLQPGGGLGEVSQPVRPAGLETDLERLDLVKKEIDALIEGTAPDVAKMPKTIQKHVSRALTKAKAALVAQMDAASPRYAQARAAWQAFTPEMEAARKGLTGAVARLDGDAAVGATKKLLDSTWTSPEAVARTMALIRNTPGGDETWNGVVRVYLEGIFDKIRSSAIDKDTFNLGGRFYKAAFGTKKQRQILKVVMDRQQYKNLEDLMRVLDRTKLLFRKESATASRQVALEELRRNAGTVVTKAAETVRRPLQAINSHVFGRNQDRLLAALTSREAAEQLAKLKKLPPNTERYAAAVAVVLAELVRIGTTAATRRAGATDVAVAPGQPGP